MKVLVVGGGGREHTIIKKLKENKEISEIIAMPGNGGIAADATCVNIAATDIDGIAAFVEELAGDDARRQAMSASSLTAAKEYTKENAKLYLP